MATFLPAGRALPRGSDRHLIYAQQSFIMAASAPLRTFRERAYDPKYGALAGSHFHSIYARHIGGSVICRRSKVSFRRSRSEWSASKYRY